MNIRFEFTGGRRFKFEGEVKTGVCLYCQECTIIPYDCCSKCLKEKVGFEMTEEYGGIGLKCVKPYKKGEILFDLPYIGEQLDEIKCKQRYRNYLVPYAAGKSPNIFDAALIRCVVSLINASDKPNCILKRTKDGMIYLEFLKDVYEEMLSIDYVWDDKNIGHKTYYECTKCGNTFDLCVLK